MLTQHDLKVIANYSGDDIERMDMANDAIKVVIAMERGESLPYSKYFYFADVKEAPKKKNKHTKTHACRECLGRGIIATGYYDDPKNQEYVPCPNCKG